jgi:hypothetical protein
MDWIGFYVPGAPEASYFDWIFVSCSKVASVALAAGSCPFTVPNVAPGTYELRLFANNSATMLASSNPVSVTSVDLIVSPMSVGVGGTVTATWSGIAAPTPMDWIGLYVPGAPEASYFDWIFVSCSKVPSVALAAGSCPFRIPNVPPGTYELRIYANNSASLLGISSAFTITP